MHAQAWVVDVVKRRAVGQLHATPRGEALLLGLYVWAEECAESAILGDALAQGGAGGLPDWLEAQLTRHAADEQAHAALLRGRIEALDVPRGGLLGRVGDVDRLARPKMARLRALGDETARQFEAGRLVPLLTVAWRIEAMSARVFARHVEVLPAEHPTAALLRRIGKDERRHVALCERALGRVVRADERPAFAALVARVDAVERAFGVTGALGMLAIGLGLRVLPWS